MKKILFLFAFIFVLTACSQPNPNHPTEPNNIDVNYPSEATIESDDFIYRLYTEKDVYDEFGDTAIWAELTYVGDEDSIDIQHAASPFYFPIEESTREFTIGYAMNEPLIIRTLEKNEPFREKYSFAGGFSDQDDKAYREFVDTIMNKGFPEGSYIIYGFAQFDVVKKENEVEEFHQNLTIGFNVIKVVK